MLTLRLPHPQGDLLCCETCPATYHVECLGLEKGPSEDEDWHCPLCCCASCGGSSFQPPAAPPQAVQASSRTYRRFGIDCAGYTPKSSQGSQMCLAPAARPTRAAFSAEAERYCRSSGSRRRIRQPPGRGRRPRGPPGPVSATCRLSRLSWSLPRCANEHTQRARPWPYIQLSMLHRSTFATVCWFACRAWLGESCRALAWCLPGRPWRLPSPRRRGLPRRPVWTSTRWPPWRRACYKP